MTTNIDMAGDVIYCSDVFTGANTPGSATGGSSINNPVGAVSPRLIHTGAGPALASTAGNDSTPVVTETYYAEVFVPDNITVTGVALFNGSATGSGNVTVYLTNLAGANVAHSASTAVSGVDTYQRIPFTAPLTVLGPGTYYVATQYNNVATRYNTFPVGNFGAGKDTGTTYGTFPTVPTIPTTFTANLGNLASLY